MDAQYLRAQAVKCRQLARGISDDKMAATLRQMADDYEAEAAAIEAAAMDGVPHPVIRPAQE